MWLIWDYTVDILSDILVLRKHGEANYERQNTLFSLFGNNRAHKGCKIGITIKQ